MAASRLCAALLIGLLVSGCGGTRDSGSTYHVQLDACVLAALPAAERDDAGAARASGSSAITVAAEVQLPAGGPPHPLLLAPPALPGALSPFSVLSHLSGGGGGKEAAIVLLAVGVVVVAVVGVVLVAEKVRSACSASRATSCALSLGGGSGPAQLLHLADGDALRLDPELADAIRRGDYPRTSLQRCGSPAALPVAVELTATQLLVRPAGTLPPAPGQGR